MPLWCPDCRALYRPLGHPGPHSAPKPTACEITDCTPENTVLRLVSLAAFGDEDRAVLVCSRHFDQWALGIREKAIPVWVTHLLRERIR